MPRRKWIDKKTAQHFDLVFRPQHDPLINDENAPTMVLAPRPSDGPSSQQSSQQSSKRSQGLSDLALQLGPDTTDQIRANEGEAATHGIYFDDSGYDYMKHLRNIDASDGAGNAVFLEAKPGKKDKQPALDQAILRSTYETQQDVPDAIAGFQPDMDPRLREVLEALDDEAYVDNEGEDGDKDGDEDDVFDKLVKEGREINEEEFEESGDFFDEDGGDGGRDDGWDSDATEKPAQEESEDGAGGEEAPDLVDVENHEKQAHDWQAQFAAFQKDQKKKSKAPPAPGSQVPDSLMTTTTDRGRRKKRKGALTSTSSYSMTSSSLVRTEQLGILDARFENLEPRYAPDYDEGESQFGDGSVVSALSTVSSVTGPAPGAFGSVLDEFLVGYGTHGKKGMRKGGWKSGTEQLDEIRRGLGPARVKGRTAKRG